MCRLLAGVSWSRRGSTLLGELALLVAEAARGDPYLRAVTGGEDRHCHGYGYVLLTRGSTGAWRISYERYDALSENVDEEEACRRNLEAAKGAAEKLHGLLRAAEEAVLVFHVRRAGRREPRGSLNAHPYSVTAAAPRGAAVLYLAHNGGLRKDELASALGVAAEAYTDSNLLALWIAKRVEEGVEPPVALAQGYRYAKSGYDVALLVVEDRLRYASPRLLYAAGMAPGLDEARRRYYAPVAFEAQGAVGFTSSTILDLARERLGDADAWMRALEEDEWGIYEASGTGLQRLHGLEPRLAQ